MSVEFGLQLFADERPENLNEIGKPTQRQDALGHVTGRSPFYDDHLFEGLLHMRCVRSPHHQVRSREPLLQALASAAGVAGTQEGATQEVAALVDLRNLRALETLANQAITPLLAAVGKGELESLVLDFEDGAVFTLRHKQRWRFWRRPWVKLEA